MIIVCVSSSPEDSHRFLSPFISLPMPECFNMKYMAKEGIGKKSMVFLAAY